MSTSNKQSPKNVSKGLGHVLLSQTNAMTNKLTHNDAPTTVTSPGFNEFLPNIEDRAWLTLGCDDDPFRHKVICVTSCPLYTHTINAVQYINYTVITCRCN